MPIHEKKLPDDETLIRLVEVEKLSYGHIARTYGLTSSYSVTLGYRAACKRSQKTPKDFSGRGQKRGESIRAAKTITPEFKQSVTGRRVIITSALNNCPIDKGFKTVLDHICKDLDAELLVVPMFYRNVSLMHSTESYYWPEELNGHYLDKEMALNKNLIVSGQLSVQATAARPLSNLQGYGSRRSLIVGHPRVAHEVVPGPAEETSRAMWSTGSISEPQYTQSKVGFLGAFHHVIGALLVELGDDNETFYVRQLGYNEKSKTVCDLCTEWSVDGSVRTIRPEALILGDLHEPETPDYVRAATFLSPNSLVKSLKPKKIIYHDIFDGLSINPHDTKQATKQYFKQLSGKNLLSHELFRWVKRLSSNLVSCPQETEHIVVGANHNDWLDRWLDSYRPLQDPSNLKIYAELLNEYLEHQGQATALECYCKLIGLPLKFIGRNESYFVEGVDLSQHGDVGPNGSRGSKHSFARTSAKTVVGHGHTPGIRDGCFQVGTMGPLHPGYRRGYSSWSHTNCLIYPNGKRSLITLRDNSYWLHQ